MKRRNRPGRKSSSSPANRPTALRIIGGTLRGRKLQYSGDDRVRPMKDRTREALFNLVGPAVKASHAIDLFAGTGAVAIEALSRGAANATLIERHAPTARIIQRNLETLDVADRARLFTGDVFQWVKNHREPTNLPWIVFCCPPYRFYDDRGDELRMLLDKLLTDAPGESLFAIEAETEFDSELLSPTLPWDIRTYSPAVIAIGRKSGFWKSVDDAV